MEEQKKIKVLMIGPARSVHGGISGVVNNYYDAGLNQKIELYYIGTMVDGSKLRKLWQAVKAFFMFCMKASKYQIIHVNVASDSSYYRKSFFIKAAKILGKKIVIHQHGGNFEEFYYKQLNDKGRSKLKRIFSMGNVFLVLSPEWKKIFSEIVDVNKIIVFPNSIKVPPIGEKKYGQHKLLFLGRICKEKGIGELFEVLPQLIEKYPDIQVYLGGIWEDKELEKTAGSYSKNVTFLGWVSGEDKNKYLELCDIFVLPTYFEGQPVSVLEAMACSCAVVASDTGGIPQMIEDGQTGILIEPKNPGSLAEGLFKVLEDVDFCRRLGENAYEKVKAEFSIENSMDKLLEIYRKVLGFT